MKISLILIFSLISLNTLSATVIAKKGKAKVSIDFNLYKDFEIKKNFMNTPVLVWHKKLKHQGPTIAFFPYAKAPRGFASAKAIKTNFSNYKKEESTNLKTLKATNLKFDEPKIVGKTLRFKMGYSLGTMKFLRASETQKLCGKNKALKIKTLIKGEFLKEFEPILLKMIDELKCN